MPIITKLVKGVSSGIGLASEAIADRKEKKAARESATTSSHEQQSLEVGESSRGGRKSFSKDDSESDSEDDELDTDRAEWALDEAAAELEEPPPSYEASAGTPSSADDVATAFVQNHNLTIVPSGGYRPLPCPVILPQRRPQDKSRGFIRAYAPLLGECAGIDQATFLDFIKELDRSSRANPAFDVINVAAFAVGMIPSPIAMGVAMAVQVVAGVGREMQTRHRRNTYLDKINETLFMPRGLYCMIMTFKPDSPNDPVMQVDLNSTDQALTKALSTPESEIRQKLNKLRLSSGVTKGDLALPESAPLVYPAIDAAAARAAQDGTALPERKQSALKSSSKFLGDYLDRRAQARYVAMNPGNKLAEATPPPRKEFASRFADPNHPVNSGSLVALLTGGHFDPKAAKRAKRAQRRAAWRGYELTEADIKNAQMGRGRRRRDQKGLIGRVLHKDVFYLTIVNLPTEKETAELMHQLDVAQGQHGQ
ncbi:hypothetical protein PV08_03079 [Exophiala spinifera]|uniref:Uncharacterized protein n=1 Tax=Exophiala spinifera TaxID=91928 RepID=A0A0D2BJL0_9EURO|nr:uncharacterized protein PV08_03079 [Exophiala spinifera]KIW18790.1 hypothetical protein PV08_03079 [Exophiala spinifera]